MSQPAIAASAPVSFPRRAFDWWLVQMRHVLLLAQTLDEIVIVSEGGVPQRMTKREAFFKILVTLACKNDRFATVLIKTMEKYDLMMPNSSVDTVKVVFVDPAPRDDDD